MKESTASFQFDKVLPGPYVGMYILHHSNHVLYLLMIMLLPYKVVNCSFIVAVEFPLWCWEKEVLEVTVERTDKPSALDFVQVGFRLEIAVPINITLVSVLIINLYLIPNMEY